MPVARRIQQAAGSARTRSVLACFLDLLVAMAIMAVLDACLFHLGGYLPIVAPNSFSGRLEASLHRLAFMHRHVPNKRFLLVAGNSTAEAAVRERLLERLLAKRALSVPVFNAARSGNSVVAWSFLLDEVPDFSEQTQSFIYGLFLPALAARHSRDLDVSVVKTRMRIRDAPILAWRQPTIEQRLAVATGGLFRTIFFREDMANLVRHPSKRRRRLLAERKVDLRLRRGFRKENQSSYRMPEAIIKGGRPLPSTIPSCLFEKGEWQPNILRRIQLEANGKRRKNRKGPQVSKMYLDLLEKMVAFLNERKIHVVFAILPSSPYPYGARGSEAVAKLVDRLQARGQDVSIFNDPRLLRILEHPRFFRDLLHLNKYGEKRYTARLAAFLADDLRAAQE